MLKFKSQHTFFPLSFLMIIGQDGGEKWTFHYERKIVEFIILNTIVICLVLTEGLVWAIYKMIKMNEKHLVKKKVIN